MDTKKVLKWVRDCLLMAALGTLFALNNRLFIEPNAFAPAGFNGVGMMLEYKTGFPVGYFMLIVNVPLCLFSFFMIDRGFAVKTTVFSVVNSAALVLFDKIDLSAFIYDAQGVDTIFPALIAGAVGGFVYGICLRFDSSTGGLDIVAKYVSKRDPLLNFFWVNFVFNAIIAAVSYFVYTGVGAQGEVIYEYKPVCLCMIYCFLSSYMGNAIIKGSKAAYKFFIVTRHADEIGQEITQRLKHGATRVEATGMYTQSAMQIVICVVNKRQIVEFKSILKKYDDTFAFVETVNETIGKFMKTK